MIVLKWHILLALLFYSIHLSAGELSKPCTTALSDLTVQAELQDLRKFVMNSFPSKNFTIVGIGQSPKVLIDDLDQQQKSYASRVPLSNFRPLYSGPKEDLRFNESSIQPSTQLTLSEKRLFPLFEKAIPLDSTRDLVLVDYASSGATLVSSYFFVKQFMKSHGLAKKISIFALVGTRFRSVVVWSMSKDLGHLGYFEQAPDMTFTTYGFSADSKLGPFFWK